ncbi:TerD family protein [Thiothrix lacustris]|uniref:TerD family protein n=1 Tax=Thiothrix lacustris TaxID=525917 RepID=A0ABY9MQ79_9GAMM|nr:TerD family protein [Thiothrix lacustris]WML90330.1 TerD family protein [Thiothrix lacustris]
MSVTQLVAGANCPVPSEKLQVEVTLSPAQISGAEVDISAFALTGSGKVRGDDDMVFYGQPRPGNGSVAFLANSAGRAEFSVDIPKLLASTEKIAFTATIHENRKTFGAFTSLQVTVKNAAGQAVLVATLPATGMVESALILGELYLRQGQWKFRAVGQGFAGGLKPLAEHFGVDISDAPAPAAAPPPPAPSPAKKPISLSKVTLDKGKPRVSLEKKSEGFGEIRINLNWNRETAPAAKSGGLLGGLFGGGNKGMDLDVGCLYEQRDGTISAIQALGNRFGSFRSDPFIELKGDDRTGAISEGEWLHINGQQWQTFKRVLVYAFIYEGAPNWAKTDGVVTIYVPNEPPLEIRMTEGGNSLGMCAVVLLENINGTLQVNREVRYFKGHQEMDQAYRWGLNWRSGSK